MLPLRSRLLTAALFLSLTLAACGSATPTPGPTAAPTQGPGPVQATATPALTATPSVTETPTLPPSRSLVVCLPDEPQTLYLYGGSSRSMWSVLEAIYDGPFDTRTFSIQPVILQKIPSLADGSAVLRPVKMQAGDGIVDAAGNLATLQAGTRVLPSGCSSPDCAVTWDGTSELLMDQLVVTFQLLPGLKWSNGEPLTAADSVFSYNLAADPATPVTKYLIDRTFSYQSLDELTVEWVGLPGYFDQRYGTHFWLPLPQHLLGSRAAADLLQDETASRIPLGWGPYRITEWTAGDHITLEKNPHYFRAAEGLPYFDTLVFRFVGRQGDNSVAAVQAGECDVVDQNSEFFPMFPTLLEKEKQGRLKTYVGQGPEWEHLDFGIRPASYEDGYDPASGDRPDLFGDVRTRRAFALCTDRQGIVDELLYRRSQIPAAFLPVSHPLALTDAPQYPYDPAAGMQLLDEVGWKDTDGDPATPRIAQGVTNVPDGTPLALTYWTTEALLRRQTAGRVAESLAGCGIQINLQFASPADLFAPGPDGLVFGRKFDLVQFSWEAGARPNCLLYTTGQIPAAANQWIGANVTGYSSAEFDRACAVASQARPEAPDFAAANAAVQTLFAQELPVLPLYAHLKIALARPDLCGFEIDPSARSIFWNLEALQYGQNCAEK